MPHVNQSEALTPTIQYWHSSSDSLGCEEPTAFTGSQQYVAISLPNWRSSDYRSFRLLFTSVEIVFIASITLNCSLYHWRYRQSLIVDLGNYLTAIVLRITASCPSSVVFHVRASAALRSSSTGGAIVRRLLQQLFAFSVVDNWQTLVIDVEHVGVESCPRFGRRRTSHADIAAAYDERISTVPASVSRGGSAFVTIWLDVDERHRLTAALWQKRWSASAAVGERRWRRRVTVLERASSEQKWKKDKMKFYAPLILKVWTTVSIWLQQLSEIRRDRLILLRHVTW